MQTAAARHNFRMPSGGIFPACAWSKSRRNARFSSISATSALTYTETSCIKDSVRIDTEIEAGDLIDTIEYDYPKFHLSMDCYVCTVKSGKLILKEHEAAKWLAKKDLYSVEWLPADLSLIPKIQEMV